MALFVLIVVGMIVAQTWKDWRQARSEWLFPDWAKGTALAGAIAVSLAAATAFTSVWLQDTADQWSDQFTRSSLWLQIAFLATAMFAIVMAIRKERLRLLFLGAAALVIVIWVGSSFFF